VPALYPRSSNKIVINQEKHPLKKGGVFLYPTPDNPGFRELLAIRTTIDITLQTGVNNPPSKSFL